VREYMYEPVDKRFDVACDKASRDQAGCAQILELTIGMRLALYNGSGTWTML